jgi:hypothetical protein
MQQKVKAFIGHSFDDKDMAVIDEFIKFFDALKIGMPFEWDHAQRPEIKAISEKVKQKMEDKNLFIGILTKKDFKLY